MTAFVPDPQPSAAFVPDGPAAGAGSGFVPDQADHPFVPDNASGGLLGTARGVQRQLAQGKPLGKALAAQPALKPADKAEADWRQRLDLIRHNPLESFFDVLSTGQRAVGGAVRAVEQHDDLRQSLGEVWKDVTLTADARQNDQIRQQTTDSIRALFHAPTHDAIGAWVNEHVPKEIQPYAKTILSGGEDFALQTASDPTSLFGGVLFRAAGGMIRGAHAATVLHAAAAANGATHLIAPLDRAARAYADAAHAIGTKVNQVFKPRNDLHAIFTHDGRRARLSIENGEFHRAGERKALDAAAVKGGTAAARVAAYRAAGARLGKKLTPQTIGQLDPAAQERALAHLNDELRNGAIASRTKSLVEQNPDLLKPGGKPIANWAKVPSSDTTSKWVRGIDDVADAGVLKAMRDVMRVSIFLNPLPHGLKNVGQLAYLAGGFPAVFRGIKAMLPAGRSPQLGAELERLGVLPTYSQHSIEDSVWGKIPGVGPAWKQAAGAMQDAMTHMEAGWRQGLWETLERKMGPATTEKDKLIRAAMVNERIGDYRNQSAFVKMFEAMGGPFVAFRLGIVPTNLVRAIAQNPERVLLATRVPTDLQNARPSAQQNRGPLGEGENVLEPGGPVSDFARMGADPLGFLTSPSTLGPVGELEAYKTYSQDHGWLDSLVHVAAPLVPIGEPLEIASNLAAGGDLPGQQMTLTDRLITSTLSSLAVYFSRMQAAKQQRAEVSRVRKEGM